ncbi:MAG: hypothetical protein ACI9DQ_001315 [Glaciecola sp.]|jgi:hypothetical protein
MKIAFKVVFMCSAMGLIPLTVLAGQRDTLFLGKLELRAKKPITELSQISIDSATAGEPYFFDRDHLYFTQILDVSSKQQTELFVWDLSKNNMRSIEQSNTTERAPTRFSINLGARVVRQKDNNNGELRAVNVNGNPDTYLMQNPEETHTSINAHQFENSNWYLYSKNQQGDKLQAYNIKTKKTIVVGLLPQGSQYFSVSATGHIIVSDGSKLYQRQIIAKGEYLQAEGEWSLLSIESTFCQSGITKTAISPYGEMIALVCAN